MEDRNQICVSVSGQSDVGLVRENNEDSFLIADLTESTENPPSAENYTVSRKGSLFLVADGMGGAEAGEVASRMAVEVVFERLKTSLFLNRRAFARLLRKSIERANRIIYEESRKDQRRKGMGTTLTAAGVYNGAIFFAQVGDSRGYLVRNGCIVQMTQDQSLVAHLVASGSLTLEEAKMHPRRNVILQALGVQKRVNVALSFAEVKRGDWIILCSDGLSGKVEAKELREVLEKCTGPKEACQEMISIACERGGEDNITVIVARFNGEFLSLPSPEDVPVYQEFEEKSWWHFWT